MRGEGRAAAPSTESHTDLPRRARQKLYAKHISTGSYFRVVDRIKLIKTILEADANAANGAGLNLNDLKAKKVRGERPNEREARAASAGGFKRTDANLLVETRARAQAILAAYPLHYYEELVPLQQKWLVFSMAPWRTPVDSIKDYFGEKVRARAHARARAPAQR